MPTIDVIMPTYNQDYFIDRAVQAMLNQSFTDFSFIIVNDGSTDNTTNVIKKYTDSRIKFIDMSINKGLPSALNVGHKNGSSEYCTWISTDNVSYSNQLESLYKTATDGDYDFVQSKWIVRRGAESIPKDIRGCKDNWGYGNLCPSFLYKRKVWETYQYDENMLCAEDLKFYLQAYLHPFKFGYCDDCLMEYYVQPNSLTFKGNPKRGHNEMLNEIYQTVIVPHKNK